MQKQPHWLAIVGLSIVGVCLLGCLALGALALFAPALYQFSLNASSLNVGTTAPDFELPALNGGTVSLSEFRGRPVILSFSASWCPDCRRGAPLLQDLHVTYPQLVVLMVDSGETQAEARQFASDFGLTHPVLLDADGAFSPSRPNCSSTRTASSGPS
jgi:thiol-disulfide isomerase/thioredoxin